MRLRIRLGIRLFLFFLVCNALAFGALAIDVTSTKDNTAGHFSPFSLTSNAFTTANATELLVVFLGAGQAGTGGMPDLPDGVITGSVSGAGLTWQLAVRTNVQGGTAEIWYALATTILTSQTVTATLTVTGGTFNQIRGVSITLVSFTGASTSTGIGATGTGNAATGAPTANLTTTQNNSWVFGVGVDWSNDTARTVGSGQTIVHQDVDSTNGITIWAQRQNSTTPASGTSVTINDTAPTTDEWNLSLAEILPFTPKGLSKSKKIERLSP